MNSSSHEKIKLPRHISEGPVPTLVTKDGEWPALSVSFLSLQ